MKNLLILTISISLLSGCTSINRMTDRVQFSEIPNEIKTFIDVCVKTAPTFSEAEKKANAYGITDIKDYDSLGKLGSTSDESMGVQIKPNKECVITTGSKKDKYLTEKFIQTVSSNKRINEVPFVILIKGERFIFHHDRKGGEAYVMLKAS